MDELKGEDEAVRDPVKQGGNFIPNLTFLESEVGVFMVFREQGR